MGFERARALDPKNGKVLWQLADLLLRQGEPEKAEAVAKDALARKVDEHRFLLKLGESQIEAKQYDEAEKSLKAALQKKPDLDTARFNLGLVYEEKGQTEQAIASYQGELAQNPKAYRAAFNLAKLLQKAGRLQEATAYFRKTVELAARLRHRPALPGQGPPRRAATSRAPSRWARSGLARKPEPELAPLGHYVLADVYNRRGRAGRGRPRGRGGEAGSAGVSRAGADSPRGPIALFRASVMIQGLTPRPGRDMRYGAEPSTSERTAESETHARRRANTSAPLARQAAGGRWSAVFRRLGDPDHGA